MSAFPLFQNLVQATHVLSTSATHWEQLVFEVDCALHVKQTFTGSKMLFPVTFLFAMLCKHTCLTGDQAAWLRIPHIAIIQRQYFQWQQSSLAPRQKVTLLWFNTQAMIHRTKQDCTNTDSNCFLMLFFSFWSFFAFFFLFFSTTQMGFFFYLTLSSGG